MFSLKQGSGFVNLNFRSIKITYLIILLWFKRQWKITVGGLFFVLLILIMQLKFNVIALNIGAVSEGLVGTYQGHDLPTEVIRLISGSLVQVDKNGRTVPGLAESWESNENLTTYTFKLRQNLKWTDGTALKAEDLEFSIPSTQVNIIDSRTIEFKLNDSYTAFPSLLTKPILKKGTSIGTGPYKIVKEEKSRIFITKLILKSTTGLPDLVIRFYPNEKTALTGFALGEVSSLLGVNIKQTNNPLVKNRSKVDNTKIVTIFYNMKDPVLGGNANRAFRQALSYGSPIIENEVEANNPYPVSSWAFNKDVKDYLGKPEEAKAALAKAKASNSEELLRKEIILTTTPQLEEVGKKVISAWRELGINGVLRVESGIPQKFQALLITQSIPEDPDQYFLWHETQDTNLTKYEQKRIDKDLEDGRKIKDEEERKEKYFDFQKVLLEDSPATFLYFPKYNIYYLKKFESRLDKILQLQFSAAYD